MQQALRSLVRTSRPGCARCAWSAWLPRSAPESIVRWYAQPTRALGRTRRERGDAGVLAAATRCSCRDMTTYATPAPRAAAVQATTTVVRSEAAICGVRASCCLSLAAQARAHAKRSGVGTRNASRLPPPRHGRAAHGRHIARSSDCRTTHPATPRRPGPLARRALQLRPEPC